MTDTENIESYLQSDAPLREGMFSAFLKSLRATASQNPQQARQWACRAVSPDLDYTSLQMLARLIRAWPEPAGPRKELRLAVLGGPTTIQLVELLNVFLAAQEIPVQVYEGDYGLFRQEILTPGSGLDRFQPNVVFLATGSRDVVRMPSPGTESAEAVSQLVEIEAGNWLQLWNRVHHRWGASVIQNTFEVSPWGAMGHYALRHPAAPENYLGELNRKFGAMAPPFVALHDLRSLVLQVGAREWFDPRFYLEAKMPCSPEALVPYAHSVSSLLMAMRGKSKKVLVLDLDNTLWGGVVGDVGLEGIEYGQGSAQGEAFVQVQEFARALRERGILLAVCSKNDEPMARLPFESREDMVLKLTDFACFIANWQNKANNLREIARRLELGVDSLVFVDDNPAERALVRRFLPEVAVPDMPADPGAYVQALCKYRYFETVSWTREDAQRADYYSQEAQRKEMAAQFQDIETFLRSLEMRATVTPVTKLNLERVAQLVNKTNQFNLTTRRRTLPEVEQISRNPQWATLTISLADKLGDSGLISVIFLQQQGSAMMIDTWLMSCRVLQRGVEELALNEIVRVSRQRNCDRLKGSFIPSSRNAMVQDHFQKLGFAPDGAAGSTAHWVLPLNDSFQPRTTHIHVERAHE